MERTILSTISKSFVSVVEQGSITAAANELGMAKSAISQNLKQLEKQAGVKLAIRTTRRFNLTPAGQRYYARCKEILATAQLALTEMESYGAIPSGPFKITAPHAMVGPIVAPALKELLSEYPLIEPELIADDTRLDVIDSAIDLAITVGTLRDSTFRARKMGNMYDVLCISSELAKGINSNDPIRLMENIEALPYIAHKRELGNLIHINLKHKKTGNILNLELRPGVRVNTIEALFAMTKQGVGISQLPNFVAEQAIKAGYLAQILPQYQQETKDIHAVHAYGKQVPTSIKIFTEHVRKQIILHTG